VPPVREKFGVEQELDPLLMKHLATAHLAEAQRHAHAHQSWSAAAGARPPSHGKGARAASSGAAAAAAAASDSSFSASGHSGHGQSRLLRAARAEEQHDDDRTVHALNAEFEGWLRDLKASK
jgi:hypothetical protein